MAMGASSAATARTFHRARSSTTIVTAAAMGAYFVLSHGSAPIAAPRSTMTPDEVDSGRQAIATITASAPGISGYTVNELKRYGPVSAAAAHANVAAGTEPVIRACPLPQQRRRERGHQDQHRDDAAIAAQGERRHGENGRPTGWTE